MNLFRRAAGIDVLCMDGCNCIQLLSHILALLSTTSFVIVLVTAMHKK